MTDMVLTRVAALKTTPTPGLKKMWQELFDTEPPAYNRRFLQPPLPGKPAGLPDPGTGLWRAVARHPGAAGGPGRNPGRRRRDEAPAAGERPADHRHPTDP